MRIAMVIGIGFLLLGCSKSELTSDFTGNEAVYGLVPASEYAVSGQVTFKERKDGFTTVLVELKGTNGSSEFPVHLHLGDITDANQDVAALLSPVDAKTGLSETLVSKMADESEINYSQLLKLAACMKIHLDDSGPGRDVVLVAGNIGANGTKLMAGGRLGIGNCSGE